MLPLMEDIPRMSYHTQQSRKVDLNAASADRLLGVLVSELTACSTETSVPEFEC